MKIFILPKQFLLSEYILYYLVYTIYEYILFYLTLFLMHFYEKLKKKYLVELVDLIIISMCIKIYIHI